MITPSFEKGASVFENRLRQLPGAAQACVHYQGKPLISFPARR